MHRHDCLQIDDFCLDLPGRSFGRLGLESWGRCEGDQCTVGSEPNPPTLQVLKWSSTQYDFLRHLSSKLSFIDEFRLFATAGVPVEHMCDLDFVMFDTSIPQQPPDKWPFDLMPAYDYEHTRASWGWAVSVSTDSDRAQGELSFDAPLVVDPTQSVVVLALNRRGAFPSGEAVLVIRTTALIRHMPSLHTCRRILWDEWKGDAMVVVAPCDSSDVRAFVIGSHVLLMTRGWRNSRDRYHVHAYDFSRWGCRALVRVGSGEKERRLMPNPEESMFPQEYSNTVKNIRVLGDRIVSCGVSDSLEPRAQRRLMSGARRMWGLPVTYTPGTWSSLGRLGELNSYKGMLKFIHS